MPAVSKKQQKFFGIVRAIQKGEMAPTTPETAKAAADMKKGDVKKFASTKHKGLPEKKKIEEDRQINKIIKQLRKSVKSHKKQADTLEKKVKTFKESNFSNITVGNKVGQTFQHVTGATITLDGALGGKMMVPSQVTIEIPDENFEGMVPITVDGPTESDFGLAGFTKPLDLRIQKRIADQSVAQINDRLDASQEASGAETARVSDIPSQDGFGGGQGNRTNRRGSAFNKDGSVNLGAKGDMTYYDVTDALNAIADRYNKKRDPLYAAIRDRRAGTGAADKIDALNRAQDMEDKAVYDAWDEFNKNYDPTITYNDTGSPDITQPDTSGSENTYSAGYEDPRSEAEAKAGYNKGIGNLSGFPSWDDLSSDLELPDTPEPPSIPPLMDPNNFDDDGNFNPPDKPGWTYDEYMKQYAALQDIAAKKSEPIVKEKLRYGPTGYNGVFKSFINRFGQKAIPMWIIDAEEAITNALTKALGALSDRWEAYNKAFQPPDGSSGPQPKSPPSTGGIEPTPIPDASNPYGTPPGGLDDEDKGDEDKGDEDKGDEDKGDEEKDDKDKEKKDKKDDTSELGDTQGEFMPSNPQGMRQQGVGKSAKDLGRHSPGTSAQQPKTKGGQGGRRLGSTAPRQGGAYGPRNPYGSGTVSKNNNPFANNPFSSVVSTARGTKEAKYVLDQASRAVTNTYNKTLGISNRLFFPNNLGGNQIDSSKVIQKGGTTFVAPNQYGGEDNPIDTKMSFASKKEWLKDIDPDSGYSAEYQIGKKSESAPWGDGTMATKAIHSQISASSKGIVVTKDGGIDINDTYAFTPGGHEHKPLPQLAKKIGGTELQKDAATFIDKSIGNFMSPSYIPGRKDPIVFIRTRVTKKELTKMWGKEKYNKVIRNLKTGGLKESKLSFKLIQQFREGLNPDRPKKLKEQTTFTQMQQRIRDAKEKRREQQKKSEKLYMDTKKKGVKFYDKKGTGRLKDGKKIYD